MLLKVFCIQKNAHLKFSKFLIIGIIIAMYIGKMHVAGLHNTITFTWTWEGCKASLNSMKVLTWDELHKFMHFDHSNLS